MRSKLWLWFAFFSLGAFFLYSCQGRSGKPRVLVFTRTMGYHHESIPTGVAAIEKLGAENNFLVDTSSDAAIFNEDSLRNYSAVVFLSTTGDLLNNYQEADFERYIQAGGGYVGIHAATDAEYDWGWYGRLSGARFASHPAQQEAIIRVVDSTDNSTKHLPREWKRKDEWYNFRQVPKDVHVLLTIDESSYQGGKNGAVHPMAWYHEYDGGRAWYTELGHTEESYSDPAYLKHILGGIQYAIGENHALDYSKATTLRVPAQERFTKTILAQGEFFEPTEFTILPNFDILVTQRRGEILLYKHDSHKVKQVGFLDVYWKTKHTPNVNAEEGLLGIQADPNFATNHFFYVYYSPTDTSVNRLSRFTLTGDTVDLHSEKIILDVRSDREICCHTGGSIAFDSQNDLFVSTGDNSTPFDEPGQPYANHGFGPLDDRPGHQQYDSRRGAGNTNDLRGKILRIKIKADGTYEIPEGNLFPKGTDKTRPEIYVMGDRNPYRISVDKKNGYLYWGEVGPDASDDSLETRGPRGYDEVNQARKAGFFGWPLFVGNNYPYHAHDYATNAVGPLFDPAKPINDSKNNTGLRELPPAQPAFVWYPYGPSPDFPQVGTGGRCAMAGPVFYSDMYPDSTRLPDYYNKKFFMYDWVRGWFKAVTMMPNGDFDKMEPFLDNIRFNAPVDVEMGPDGKMYVLEYGNGWFTKNPDAAIARIDYNAGNIAPGVTDISVDKVSGVLPLTVTAKVEAKDYEHEPLHYIWETGDGAREETNEPVLKHTFKTAGSYAISVTVKDPHNASTKSGIVSVYAGNTTPSVAVKIKGNQSYYFPGQPVQYATEIRDGKDAEIVQDPKGLVVSANYAEGSDKAAVPQGHQQLSAAAMGKNIMMSQDCKTCHKTDEKSIGPAFTEVAKRYNNDPKAVSWLVEKITKGGSGKWGEVAMPAHPTLKEEDIRLIIGWIQSLGPQSGSLKSLPATGAVDPTMHQPSQDKGVLTITATYTNQGGNHIEPLTGTGSAELRNSRLYFGESHNLRGGADKSDVDLDGVKSAVLELSWTSAPVQVYQLALRLDSAGGKQIGTYDFKSSKAIPMDKGQRYVQRVSAPLEAVNDGRPHALYLVSTGSAGEAKQEPSVKVYLQLLQK